MLIADQRSRKLRITYCILLGATLIFTLYEELHLRRWLFHHLGSSSILAGSFPNFLAVMVFSFAFTAIKLPQSNREIVRTTVSVVVGLILYEIAQIWMPSRVFDWNDIAASILGGVFCWIVLSIPRLLIQPS